MDSCKDLDECKHYIDLSYSSSVLWILGLGQGFQGFQGKKNRAKRHALLFKYQLSCMVRMLAADPDLTIKLPTSHINRPTLDFTRIADCRWGPSVQSISGEIRWEHQIDFTAHLAAVLHLGFLQSERRTTNASTANAGQASDLCG